MAPSSSSSSTGLTDFALPPSLPTYLHTYLPYRPEREEETRHNIWCVTYIHTTSTYIAYTYIDDVVIIGRSRRRRRDTADRQKKKKKKRRCCQ